MHQTYIALFRGINVSGQKIILMKDLKTLFEKTGFSSVRTYIQSGNVLFSSPDAEGLAEKIEKAVKKNYGFHAEVIIRTPKELKKIIASNPFAQKDDTGKLYICFFKSAPSKEAVNSFMQLTFNGEEFSFAKTELYLYFPDGYGKSKLNNNVIEKKLTVISTARNWNTTNKLYELTLSSE